jgi:hypothetical protein
MSLISHLLRAKEVQVANNDKRRFIGLGVKEWEALKLLDADDLAHIVLAKIFDRTWFSRV